MNFESRLALGAVSSLSELNDTQRAVLVDYLEPVLFQLGESLFDDGSSEAAVLFVLAGQVSLRRADRPAGVATRGDCIGAAELLCGIRDGTAATAATEVSALRMRKASFSLLAERDPAVALAVQTALIRAVAPALHEALTLRGTLVRERSLPRKSRVEVAISGRRQWVAVGTPLCQLLPSTIDGRLVVGAEVSRNLVSLSSPVSSACEIEAITAAHWEGQRIYRQSLALLALEAMHEIEPAIHAYTGYTIGFAQRLNLPGVSPSGMAQVAQQLEARMLELAEQQRPLLEEVWTVQEAREYFEHAGWKSTARVLELSRDSTARLAAYGTQYCLAMGPLLPDTGALTGFSVVADSTGLLLVYGARASHRPQPSRTLPMKQAVDLLGPDIVSSAFGAKEPSAPVPAAARLTERFDRAYVAQQARTASEHVERMTSEQRHWLQVLEASSVGDFNHACIHGDVPQLIRVAEGFQEKRISKIAEAIRARADEVRAICIAGPSSSGKTTFIRRLSVQLQVEGLRPVGLSLDDYYVDRERTPRDSHGQADFESLAALRLDLLQQHLRRLFAGEAVTTAKYDFQGGKSSEGGGPRLQLGPRDMLLLEGIHGLNPKLLSGIGDERAFRIFVCPLLQLPFDRLSRIHASDVRLLRRIVRDRHTRGANAADNIQRWPSVRAGERAHIFPFQHHADAVFDSSLVYELSVLKVFAERYLLEVPEQHPAYTTAFRLMQFTDRFVTIYPDQVPANSILREFIGGSGFKY